MSFPGMLLQVGMFTYAYHKYQTPQNIKVIDTKVLRVPEDDDHNN
jgi:hypothetical protein